MNTIERLTTPKVQWPIIALFSVAMRIILLLFLVSALSLTGFGQGIVNFANNPSTLVSYVGLSSNGGGLISDAGKYYFGLLTSASGAAGSFSFTGVYATNSATAPGRFVNNGVSVPNWAAGARLFYEVAVWHSSLGAAFNPAWLFDYPGGPFGISAVGSGVAGGLDSQGRPFPPLPLFGGTGITSGFTICCIERQELLIYSTGGRPFGFEIFSLASTSFVIEASTNLAPQSWSAVQVGRLGRGSMYFSDPKWTNYLNRFYRIRTLEEKLRN